jgi:hypothetical protein
MKMNTKNELNCLSEYYKYIHGNVRLRNTQMSGYDTVSNPL